jgi:hypothetical protein
MPPFEGKLAHEQIWGLIHFVERTGEAAGR